VQPQLPPTKQPGQRRPDQRQQLAEDKSPPHPRSLSVREEHLLSIVDNWLGELFEPDNIEGTCMTLERSQQNPQAAVDELEARRVSRNATANSPTIEPH